MGWVAEINSWEPGRLSIQEKPTPVPRARQVVMVDRVFDGVESFPQALAYPAEGRHFSKIARRIA
jgi:hypothetical protein